MSFLQELTSERPVVVLVEDLHWAGDELCDLLQMLAERVAGPLLLVVTARPELLDQRPGWPAAGSLVRLEALPATEAEQLVGALLGSSCPAPIRELVAERAEGNPFFVEELIATLAGRGSARPAATAAGRSVSSRRVLPCRTPSRPCSPRASTC